MFEASLNHIAKSCLKTEQKILLTASLNADIPVLGPLRAYICKLHGRSRLVREAGYTDGFYFHPLAPVNSLEHSPFGISILAILEGGDEPAEFFATTLMM